MKTLLFIMLAGCAVRCEENNYYVIEVPEQPLRSTKTFKVYWNVPTMQCASKKIHFKNLYEKFGIIQNENDRFKGEKVTILYDPGLFPALLKNESSGRYRFRNGGVPQDGDLDRHLLKFKEDLDESVPDEDFSGVGIIDFESWRPVFRQNFGTLQPYKDVSVEIERKLHPWWRKQAIEAEARSRFTKAARSFMESTLVAARTLRPRAVWGFYGFPYCFNMAANNMNEGCAKQVPEENDAIPWLWSKSTALYPSLYSHKSLTSAQLVSLIRGRVREAARHRQTNILPYMWFRYRDGGYFTQNDLNAALSTIYNSAASGIIIWGSSNDVDTVPKCTKLYDYIENTFGPAIAKYTKHRRFNDVDNDLLNITHETTTENTNSYDNINLTTKLEVRDPEYHFVPPENYTEEIKKQVEEQLSLKLNATEKPVHNGLIDFLLNYVLNQSDNFNLKDEKTMMEYLDMTDSDLKYTTVTNLITNSPVFEQNSKLQDADNIMERPVEMTTENNANRRNVDYFDLSEKNGTNIENKTSTLEPTTEEVFNYYLNMNKLREELFNLNNNEYTTENINANKYEDTYYDDFDITTNKKVENFNEVSTTEGNNDFNYPAHNAIENFDKLSTTEENFLEYMSIGDDDTTDINTDYFETFVDDIGTAESFTNKTVLDNPLTELSDIFENNQINDTSNNNDTIDDNNTTYDDDTINNNSTNDSENYRDISNGDNIFSDAISKLMEIFGKTQPEEQTNKHTKERILQDVNTTDDNVLLTEELKRLENVLDAESDFNPTIDSTDMTYTTEQVDL